MRKKIIIFLLMCALGITARQFNPFAAAAYSAPFAIQISQFDKVRSGVNDSSMIFEDIMLDYFFEAGYIVSNLPANTTDDPDNAPVTEAIKEAGEGSLDYVAAVILVYDRSDKPVQPDHAQFSFASASWKLYRVSDGKMVSSGKIKSIDVTGSDIDTNVKNCARSLSRELDAILRKI
jgi:hypothetical protein